MTTCFIMQNTKRVEKKEKRLNKMLLLFLIRVSEWPSVLEKTVDCACFSSTFLNGFEERMWVLIARIPNRWLSVYFTSEKKNKVLLPHIAQSNYRVYKVTKKWVGRVDLIKLKPERLLKTVRLPLVPYKSMKIVFWKFWHSLNVKL